MNTANKTKKKSTEKKLDINEGNELFNSAISSLQPSRELVDFYRRKVTELSGDHEMLLRRVEQLGETSLVQHKQGAEVREREVEIAELQRALSDMQVYLFKEREQVLRLYAENDRLKIREVEDRRKMAHLLQLSSLTQAEVTYFMREPPSRAVVAPTQAVTTITSDGFHTTVGSGRRTANLSSRAGTNNNASSGGSVNVLEHEAVKRECESCRLQIQALQSQLEEQTRLYKEHTDALMEDRRIRHDETESTKHRDVERIQELSDKLKRTQELLYESTKDFLSQRSQYREKEKQLIGEKDTIYRRLQLKESSLSNLSKEGARCVRLDIDDADGGLMGRAWSEHNAQAAAERERALRQDLQAAEQQLEQTQSLAETHREQAIASEGELGRLREQEEAVRDIYKDRASKIQDRLQLTSKRYKQLERRRCLEVSGFQTDIAALRKKLRNLEKQLYTMYHESHAESRGATDAVGSRRGKSQRSGSTEHRSGGAARRAALCKEV